jgi:predicted ribosome quality control (RQC) complex YloA/Tae2 family protein
MQPSQPTIPPGSNVLQFQLTPDYLYQQINVESPVAMAIPIPDEGIYLALAVPNEAGLEAMGSYSGIQARGTKLLQTRKTLSEQQRSRLKNFAGQLRKNPNAPNLPNQWKEIIQQGQGHNSPASLSDINALIQYVLPHSYLETNKDLQFYASKIKAFNEQKKQLREQIQATREKLTQANEANEKEALEEMIEKMEQALQALEDQDRQINFKIQQLMSQYNQAEQTASNVLKKQDDAQSNAIRKIN